MTFFRDFKNAAIDQFSSDPAMKKLIEVEKDQKLTFEHLAKNAESTATAIQEYGSGQSPEIFDVAGIHTFFNMQVSGAFETFSDSYNDYREKLKDIHKSHAILVSLEKNHKKIKENIKLVIKSLSLKPQAAKAKKQSLQTTEQLVRQGGDVGRQIDDFKADFEKRKRMLYQEGLGIQYKAWAELGQKLQTIGSFGQYVAQQFNQDQYSDYQGIESTKQIKADYLKAVEQSSVVSPSAADTSMSLGYAATNILNSPQAVNHYATTSRYQGTYHGGNHGTNRSTISRAHSDPVTAMPQHRIQLHQQYLEREQVYRQRQEQDLLQQRQHQVELDNAYQQHGQSLSREHTFDQSFASMNNQNDTIHPSESNFVLSQPPKLHHRGSQMSLQRSEGHSKMSLQRSETKVPDGMPRSPASY